MTSSESDSASATFYAVTGVVTAGVALFVDHVLWTVVNLGFSPGVLLGLLAPLVVGLVGVGVGYGAVRVRHERIGYGVIGLNVLAAVLGVLWGMAFARGGLFGTV
ncbi:hypothetical protein [Halomarina oriensis]|uniref:Uncharacterized protein n=1 Tax=Halomarina oriensis TaxID=671145 RepID=A0A6B0GII3_9EURY|nr:hypothetical protein [Halomarina oriensis]MWG34686.1 hypothetical protein [Halomarina oriensis]